MLETDVSHSKRIFPIYVKGKIRFAMRTAFQAALIAAVQLPVRLSPDPAHERGRVFFVS
jgi:hypothetical protein